MPELVVSQIGPWGIVVCVAYAFLRGHITSGASLRERERLVDLYREAFEREHAARELADKQLGEMLEYGRTANDVLGAVQASAPPAEGEPDVASVA